MNFALYLQINCLVAEFALGIERLFELFLLVLLFKKRAKLVKKRVRKPDPCGNAQIKKF